MWQVEVIKINIQEMLSLDYRTYITSRIRLKSASCFSGLWIKTIPKHLVHTASKYFAISKFTLFFSRTYDHLCQSSLWSMQKLSADTDKLPVDFAKTSHTIDNFYQLFRIHIGGHYNAHDVPKAPTYPIKRILDHSFLIEYTPNISKREICSTDGKIMFYYSTDGKIMFYYSTDGKIMFYPRNK